MFIPACRRHFPLSCHSDRLCLLWHAEKTHQAPDCSPLALKSPDICALLSFSWKNKTKATGNAHLNLREKPGHSCKIVIQCSHTACCVWQWGSPTSYIYKSFYSQLWLTVTRFSSREFVKVILGRTGNQLMTMSVRQKQRNWMHQYSKLDQIYD